MTLGAASSSLGEILGKSQELATFVRYTLGHASSPSNRLGALARFAFRQVHKRVVRRPLIVRWEGYQLEVHPDSHYAASAFYLTWPDFWELTFLNRFLRPGDAVIDAGANVGVYSMFLARRVGTNGIVFACEPDPTNLSRLRANLDRNSLSQVRVVPAALGDHEGVAHFDTGQDTVGQVLRNGGGTEVRMTTIDAVVEGIAGEAVVAPTYIKVDVEGYEAEVVGGAQRLAERGMPLVWQVELWGQGDSGPRTRLAEVLTHRGYDFFAYDLEQGTLVLRDYRQSRDNLFAIRDLDTVLRRLEGDAPR